MMCVKIDMAPIAKRDISVGNNVDYIRKLNFGGPDG